MVRVAVDAVGSRSGGGATILLNVLEELVSHPDIEVVRVYTSPSEGLMFSMPRSSKLEWVPLGRRMSSAPARPLWAQLLLPLAVSKGVDVVLALTGTGLSGTIPRVTYFQQALALPRSYAGIAVCRRIRARTWVTRQFMRVSLASADAVAVQSDHLIEPVVRGFGVEQRRVFVTPTPLPDWGPKSDRGAAIPSAYIGVPPSMRFLYVGSAEPHKNVEVLWRAADMLSGGCPLRVFATLAPFEGPAADWFVPLGQVLHQHVDAYYKEATALVMPSLVETLGLPLMEGLSAGIPIISSDLPFARSVCADAAIYFDPRSPYDLANCLEAVAKDEVLRSYMQKASRDRATELRRSYDRGGLPKLLVRLGC